jgi:AcrR family transcriptional regulator
MSRPEPIAEVQHPAHARNDDKERQILDGARSVFLANGFDGASMNDIARAAGVSKGTLYVYFDSKEALFEALVRRGSCLQAEQICQWENDAGDIRDVLKGVGMSLMEKLMTPWRIAQVRTVLAVAPKFPGLGRAFYESGPGYGRARLAEFLDKKVAAGVLEIDDTQQAATLFLQLCKSDIFMQKLFGIIDEVKPEEIEQSITRAVDVFLRAYGKKER